jgi:GT2 family glycosyltransferase
MFTREAIAECGLPLKDMFIWYDDVEYTARVELRGFAGAVVPDSIVEHRTKLNYTPDFKDITAQNYSRFRYAFRNEVLVLRTLLEGRRMALAMRFVRLMLRRIALMMKARKFRYLFQSIFHGFNGLTMERRVEFPSASGSGPNNSCDAVPANPAATTAHVSQA